MVDQLQLDLRSFIGKSVSPLPRLTPLAQLALKSGIVSRGRLFGLARLSASD
jgi:hypothetical protein